MTEYSQEGDIGWAGIAKNFGGGVIAAVNPFIGVPLLVANFLNEGKKSEEKQKIIEVFFSNLYAYQELLEDTVESYQPIYDGHVREMESKLKTFLIDPWIKLLKIFDDKGHSLKQCVIRMDDHLKIVISDLEGKEE